MIEVKEAVANALRFLGDMYPGDQIRHSRLEEVELSEDGLWHVTISYVRDFSPTELADIVGGRPAREYKVITIYSDSGKMQSMKIRQFT